MALGFWMSNKNCYGCKTCSIACKSEKRLNKGVLLRRVTEIRQDAPLAVSFLSMSCNHCEDPACLKNCPVQAYTKLDNGIVQQDHDPVHRLQNLHRGVPVPCSLLRRGGEQDLQVRPVRRPPGARRASRMRGGVPRHEHRRRRDGRAPERAPGRHRVRRGVGHQAQLRDHGRPAACRAARRHRRRGARRKGVGRSHRPAAASAPEEALRGARRFGGLPSLAPPAHRASPRPRAARWEFRRC